MKNVPRRVFLADSLRGAAVIATAGLTARRARGASPNEQIVIGAIGVGGMGHHHLGNLARRDDVRIAYLCDVDESRQARAADTIEKNRRDGKPREAPALVGDFRKVLDDPAVDAVVIATPNHWHTPIAVRAMQAGKDCYVEKPAGHTFREGRLLIEAAGKYKRVVQQGTQMRSSKVTAEAGEVLASGLIGEVKMTKAWNVQRQTVVQPRPNEPVPPGVDYDTWLGPAPERPFNRNRFHYTWRFYRDYANGDIGDDGIHDIDMARWALGVTAHPDRITAHGSRVDLPGQREYPDNMMVAYQYENDKVLLYEDRLWTPYGLHGFDSGNAFYGTKGYMIFSRRGYFQVYLGKDEKKGPGLKAADDVAQPAPAHMADFLDCVRTRGTPKAPPQVAHLSCGLVHLGEIAYRLGRVLTFDPKSETFGRDREANAMLTKEYRSPWAVPDPV